MFQSRNLAIAVLLPLFVLTACTRAKEDVTNISLSIPHSIEVKSKASGKVTSQALTSTQVLGHVIINASGAGIPSPILFTWDSCHDCLNAPPPPTSFTLDIPQGEGRLVQVLAVYMDEASNSMSFYYGDVTAVLNQTAQVLTIPVASLGVSQQIVSGSIAGRYFSAPDVGPTGLVYVKYNPPGKPSMIIEKSHIINGWFNFFTLKGIDFSYEMDGGLKLFGGPVSSDSAVFTPSSSILKVTKPIHNRNDSWGGTPNWRESEPEISILGWFGDPASYANKIVCRDFTSSPTFTKETSLNSTSTFLTMVAGTPPADLFANSSSVYYQGGASTGCSDPANKFLTYFSVTTSSFDGKGKDGFAGFRSPLKDTDYGSPFNISVDTAGNRVISGQLMPHITQIQKFRLYKQVGSYVQNFKMEQMNCGAITRGEMPEWIFAGEGTAAADGSFTINSTVSSADVTNMTVGALCFAGPFGYYPYGMGIRTDNWGGYGGGGTSQPPATQIVLESPLGTTFNTDTCVPLRLVAKDANNNPTSNVTASVTVNMTGGMGMYSDPSCTSYVGAGYNGTFNFSNDSSHVFYFRSMYPSTTYDFTISSTPSLATIATSLTTLSSPTSATKMGLFNMDGSPFNTLNKFECQSALLILLDAQNRPASYSGSNISLSDSSSSGTQFFADESTCRMNSAPLSSIGATGGSTKFIVINNNTSNNPSVILSFTEPGLTALSQSLTLQQPGAPSYFYISYANMQWNGSHHLVAKGVCLPVQFYLADSYGRVTASSSAVTLTPSSATGTSFFSNDTCTTALSGGVSFAANSPSAGAYMFVNGNAAQSITLSGTLNGSAFSSTYPGMGMSELMPSPITPTIMPSSLPSAVFQNICYSLSSIQFGFSGTNWNLNNSPIPVKVRFKDGPNINPVAGFTLYNDSECTSPAGGIAPEAGSMLTSNNLYFEYSDNSTPYFGAVSIEMSTDQGSTYNMLGQVGRGAKIVPQAPPANGTCDIWAFDVVPYVNNGMSTYVPSTYPSGVSINISSASNILGTSCSTPNSSATINQGYITSTIQAQVNFPISGGPTNVTLEIMTGPGMDFRFTNGQINMPFAQ